MLERVGIHTEITKVADESYFKDHIASGDYDLALYSWPASAYPATDARPIFAKPEPATDGSLLVEQNYTRVGTDHIDQLFDQAVPSWTRRRPGTWCAGPTPGSGPRPDRFRSTSAPQLVAAKRNLRQCGRLRLRRPPLPGHRFQEVETPRLLRGSRPGTSELPQVPCPPATPAGRS